MDKNINWVEYLKPQVNINYAVDDNGNEYTYTTTDYVTLREDKGGSLGRKTVTDFALTTDAVQRTYFKINNKYISPCWIRGNGKTGDYSVPVIDGGGRDNAVVNEVHVSSCPKILLDINKLKNNPELYEYVCNSIYKGVDGKRFLDIGKYAKKKVKGNLSQYLEVLYSYGRGVGHNLKCTGILYTSNRRYDNHEKEFQSQLNPEFEYNGIRYIRRIVNQNNGSNLVYEDGQK